uniref:Histone-lysine N-methyltransferase SETMAR n=1 Tax=Heterorhabditis bacteriophora TaxID=37862 RepID=A0A1I7WQ18_HETBA
MELLRMPRTQRPKLFSVESLEDAPRSERPLSLNDEDLRTAMKTNSKLTCGEYDNTFNVNEETIRQHFHQPGKRWKLSKWVPHSLIHENKLQRLTICSSHLARSKTESLFDRILTSDEIWIIYSNDKRFHH